ncbi:MAG TPA: hypothetical protein VE869_05060 [Gemmatimonas sp.]|nr:hypothetical protein [Gemmatimonas sp.]
MRSPIARTVLITFALAGCGADAGGNLLEPSVSSFARSANADTKTKHIRGTLETVETDLPGSAFPILRRRLEGTGTASHLGRFTVVANITLTVNPLAGTGTGIGTGTYTAANGDVLTTTAVGQAVVVAGIATVTETVTVTGGTGRFEGATGTLVVMRRVVQATGASTGTIDGTITLPK